MNSNLISGISEYINGEKFSGTMTSKTVKKFNKDIKPFTCQCCGSHEFEELSGYKIRCKYCKSEFNKY